MIKIHEYDIPASIDLTKCQFDETILSATWVTALLKILQSAENISLIEFHRKAEIVGYCLLGKRKTRFGTWLYLNQTGDPHLDQMWIEHNDVFCPTIDREECRIALLDYLTNTYAFNKFFISLSLTSQWQSSKTFQWSKDVDHVCYVDMHKLRNDNTNFQQSLSSNTRSNINRSLKFIENNFGKIEIEKINEGIPNLLTDEIGPLHIAQWETTELGSGFANPSFFNFHQHLAQQSSKNYYTEILKFSARDNTLGYLYFIIHKTHVYFYLSAINYSLSKDNRYKPGMLMHKIAIEHYLNRNFSTYDFLAGYARYKDSLSNAKYPMYNIELSKNNLFNKLLYAANRIKKRVLRA